jgi:hypothetical protein
MKVYLLPPSTLNEDSPALHFWWSRWAWSRYWSKQCAGTRAEAQNFKRIAIAHEIRFRTLLKEPRFQLPPPHDAKHAS